MPGLSAGWASIGPDHQASLPAFGSPMDEHVEPQLVTVVSAEELHASNRSSPTESEEHPIVDRLGRGLFKPLGPYKKPRPAPGGHAGGAECMINPQQLEAGGEPVAGWLCGLAPGEQQRIVSASSGKAYEICHSDTTGALVCFKAYERDDNGRRVLCEAWKHQHLPGQVRFCKHVVELHARLSESGAAAKGLAPVGKMAMARAKMALMRWQERGLELLGPAYVPAQEREPKRQRKQCDPAFDLRAADPEVDLTAADLPDPLAISGSETEWEEG